MASCVTVMNAKPPSGFRAAPSSGNSVDCVTIELRVPPCTRDNSQAVREGRGRHVG